jgi:uncharacterized coiled-coil DUF342 family protein
LPPPLAFKGVVEMAWDTEKWKHEAQKYRYMVECREESIRNLCKERDELQYKLKQYRSKLQQINLAAGEYQNIGSKWLASTIGELI